MKSKKSSLDYRSNFLVEVFKDWVPKDYRILEIGCGDGRNLRALREAGYSNVEGIDKKDGTSVEDSDLGKQDVIFSMSTLFLIPPENNWVFEKIARAAKKYIITVEGEVTDYRRDLWGRDYSQVFKPFGFKQVLCQDQEVFNDYGVLRVLEKQHGTS